MREPRIDEKQVAQDGLDNETRDRKHKKRCKKTIAQLKEQIEFYFCDANLLKDRFMKQAISSHPEGYVKIDTIASFNRIKQLTDDANLVIKAIKLSNHLEVSSDNSAVRRTTPLPQPRNVDAETVYVERLPPYADIDWIKSIFSQYGKVQYVSLPRFKNTREIKGFAFVEFEAKEQAQAALQSFAKGNKSKKELESSEVPDQTEQSADHNKLKSRRKRSHSESDEIEDIKPAFKRKRTASESSSSSLEHNQSTEFLKQTLEKVKESSETETEKEIEEEVKTKRRKKSVKWEEGNKEKGNIDARNLEATGSEPLLRAGSKRGRGEGKDEHKAELRIQHKCVKSTESDSNAESCGEEKDLKDKKQTKKRKRKKKDKKEMRNPHLRVISKLDWLRLKAEYKELQRQSIQNLKLQLQQSQTNGSVTREDNKQSLETKKPVAEEVRPPVAKLPYTPGVVLKFKSVSKDLIARDVRDKFTHVAPVAYLDLQDGCKQGFVRFHTAGRCQEFLDKFSSEELIVETLNGDEERQYWEKINADRMARYKAKREKKRGSEKVVKKVEAIQKKRNQHFHFDDNES